MYKRQLVDLSKKIKIENTIDKNLYDKDVYKRQSEYYENNISSKSGITINAKLVNKDNQNSSTKSYTVPLSQYGTDNKGNITIDLYGLVKDVYKRQMLL